jgi:hypothetical protein
LTPPRLPWGFLLLSCVLLAVLLGVPRRFSIVGGDEPHYLLLLHSLVRDRDFNLRNNYEQAAAGDVQAGTQHAGTALDHHVSYYLDDVHRPWSSLFETDSARWPPNAAGIPTPPLRPGVDPSVLLLPEHTFHNPGLGLVLAPFIAPFAQTNEVEAIAIVLAMLACLGALWLYRRWLRRLGATERAALLVTAFVFLGTPILYYGRTVFTEPFVLLGVVGTFAWLDVPLLAGGFAAWALFIKPQLAVILLPIGVQLLRERRIRELLFLSVFPALGTLGVLYLNHRLYGAPWRMPYPFSAGDFLSGFPSLLLSPLHGVLPFAPVLLFATPGWRRLLRLAPSTWTALAAFGVLFVLTASWFDWAGGACYGPRLLVPVLPLFGLGLLPAVSSDSRPSRAYRAALGCVAAISILLNFAAVRYHWESFDRRADRVLLRLFVRPARPPTVDVSL